MPWIEHEDLGATATAVVSSRPEAMRALQNLIQSLTFGSSGLTRVQEEAIATVVSTTAKCRY